MHTCIQLTWIVVMNSLYNIYIYIVYSLMTRVSGWAQMEKRTAHIRHRRV